MKFTFKHLSGSRAGQEQALEGSVIGVGRNPTNQLAFDPAVDDRVSGNHAQLVVMGEQVTVNDMGSRNGTFVNGQPVTGPTVVPSGAVLQFGSEGGPKVLVTYVAAPAAPATAPTSAAPAAAPPPKKGGAGKIVCLFGCFALFMLAMCGLGGYMFYDRAAEQAAVATEVPDDGEVATAGTPAADAPAPEGDAPPATEAAPPARRKIPWARLNVGSSFEMKSTTDMKMGEQSFTSESTMRQTLVAVDDQHATVKTEVIVPNVPPSESEMKLAIYPEAVMTTEEQPKVEEKPAEVTVPAGTFTCTYRKMTTTVNGQETVTETWSSDDEPVPYKMVSVGPQSRTVTELTKIDKK